MTLGPNKLGRNAFHLLLLAQGRADAEAWAPVSNVVWPAFNLVLDDPLDREWPDGAELGRCHLTAAGNAVLKYGSPTNG